MQPSPPPYMRYILIPPNAMLQQILIRGPTLDQGYVCLAARASTLVYCQPVNLCRPLVSQLRTRLYRDKISFGTRNLFDLILHRLIPSLTMTWQVFRIRIYYKTSSRFVLSILSFMFAFYYGYTRRQTWCRCFPPADLNAESSVVAIKIP